MWHEDGLRAARGLFRAKGFTGVAVLMLALGITGTTVMFALVEGVLLRKLPLPDQDRVIVAWERFPTGSFEHWPFRGAEIDAIGAHSRLLEGVAGVGYNAASAEAAVPAGSLAEIDNLSPVTGSFFAVLGVEAALGRTLKPADDLLGAENVLVLTHAAWQRRFGGAVGILGRRVSISGQAFAVVGVMPPDFDYPGGGIEGWMTVAACASTLTNPTFKEAVRNELDLVARLRPGVTLAQAEGELSGLIRSQEAEAPPAARRGLLPVVRSLEDLVVGHARGGLIALFGAMALVLFIASANVANLFLLRVEARRTEIAVRAALGAGRGRLARELLAECVLVVAAAGAIALLLARGVLGVVMAIVPGGLPRNEAVRIDPGVVAFSLGTVVLVTMLAGVAPALSSVRLDLVSALQSGHRALGGRARVRGLLVVAQAALAVTVVGVAGLLVRSLLRLDGVNTGLPVERLTFVALTLPGARYADRERHLHFLEEVVRELEAAPGIEGATPVNAGPFAGAGWDAPTFVAEGQDEAAQAANPSLSLEAVHPGHFRALGASLVSGRDFDEEDVPKRPEVAIVSEDVAARAWRGQDPLGKRLRFPGSEAWRTIVGVARSTRYRDLREPRPTIYVPAPQFIVSAQSFVVRSAASPGVVAGLVRDRVHAIDSEVEVARVVSFDELRAGPLARPRWHARLIAFFGATALLLTLFGLYAVMGADVRRSHGEIGVRMALGATISDMRRLVLRRALRLAGKGVVLGLAGALLSGRLVRDLLYEIDPVDPASMMGAAALLMVAALLASYAPARRAARVDPAAVLRSA